MLPQVAGGSKSVDIPLGSIPAGTLIRTHYNAFMPLGGTSETEKVKG